MCSRAFTNGRSSSRVIRRSERRRCCLFADEEKPDTSRSHRVSRADSLVLTFTFGCHMRVSVILFSLVLVTEPLLAQQTRDTTVLRPVVVTATRVPIDKQTAPASVTVLRG